MTITEEQAAFDHLRSSFIDEGHGGQYVLFKDGAMQEYFSTSADAYREGLKRYGTRGVFIIDQVAPKRLEALSMSWELGLMSVE